MFFFTGLILGDAKEEEKGMNFTKEEKLRCEENASKRATIKNHEPQSFAVIGFAFITNVNWACFVFAK